MSEASSPQKILTITDSAENSPSKQPPSPIQKSKTGGNELSSKPTFVTGMAGMNTTGKKGFVEEKGKIDEVYNYHDKLNGLIEQLDSKVRTLLNENQTNFLMAYKEQMLHIQKELKALKKKIDEETYKRKNDERMNILEQERDWFRAEAIRLDKVCKEQQRVMQDLKFKLKMVNEDKNYFEEFVLTAKKENKALKEELIQFELGRKSTDEPNIPTSTRKTQLSSSAKKELSPSPRRSYDVKEDFARTDNDNLKNFTSNPLPTYTNEEKLLEVIKQMKIELDKEKKLNRQLRNEKSQIIVQRIELEQILAESINEVKKDIARRRNTKTLKDINRGPPVPQDIDISKFSATDKKHLLEHFISNEVVLEELYHLVFNNPNPLANLQQTPSEKDGQMLANTPNTNGAHHKLHKSDGKLKYSFNYGFGGGNNIRTLPKELNNVMTSQKAHNLIGELRRPEAKKAEFFRKDL